MKTLVLRGGEPTDDMFTIKLDGVEHSWNTTKMRRDAEHGAFGPVISIPCAKLPPPDWETGAWDEIDKAQVESLKDSDELNDFIAIAIGSPPGMQELPMLCFADGSHRVTACQELGFKSVRTWVIPWEEAQKYRVTFDEVDLFDISYLQRLRL